MDEPILQIEKITGIGQKNAACGVFVGRITLGDGTLGTLVSCILAEGADNDAGDLLRDIFELSTKKLENSQGGSLKAVKVAHDACRQYAQDNQKNLKVSFVLAFFYESACYIARHADKIKIFVFEPPKSIEIKFEEGSGPLKPGQIYLIATEKFLPIFDSSIFSDNQEVDLQEIIDGLATEISARDDQSEIGAAMVMVKSKEPQESDGTEEPKEPQETKEETRETEEPATAGTSFPIRVKNPLPLVLTAVFSEAKKLTKGDLRAILRLRRNMAIVAVVILFILAGSAIFTIRQKNEREKMSQVNDYLAQASAKYSEAEAIIELNKIRAREVLIDAQGNVKSAQAIDSDNERANKLASDISQKLKETEVQENISFQVLSELSQPVSSLSTRGKKIVGVGADRIVEVDPDSKSIDETEGLESAVSGFVYDNKAFVLADSKVHRVDLASSKIEKIIENGEGFDESGFIHRYRPGLRHLWRDVRGGRGKHYGPGAGLSFGFNPASGAGHGAGRPAAAGGDTGGLEVLAGGKCQAGSRVIYLPGVSARRLFRRRPGSAYSLSAFEEGVRLISAGHCAEHDFPEIDEK